MAFKRKTGIFVRYKLIGLPESRPSCFNFFDITNYQLKHHSMKRKFLFVGLVLLALNFYSSAATVTQSDARSVALNFFNITTNNNQVRNPLTATLQYSWTESDGSVDFYVFNMSPIKGFVIVSGTDNDDPIIGYSTESTFRTDFTNVGLVNWLHRWSEELHYVILNNVVASPLAATRWTAYRAGYAPPTVKSGSVSPLCQTTWDQDNESGYTPALYNNYCPGSGQNQAVTGCVATAMAQIMKYWNYPATGTGSSSYDDETSQGYQEDYGTLSFNYGNTTFQWTNMPNELTNSSTTTQIDAIGTLMYACGVSVDMDYSPSGSGAIVFTDEAGGGACAQKSYVQYFGYQNIVKSVGLSGTNASAQQTLSSTALTDTIEAELNAGRPVEVQGTDQTYGGHTWVCDGYNTSNQLHMNWGWSGYSDGYFSITNLDPNDGDQLDFTEDVGALIHIQPPVTSTLNETATAGSSSVCAGSSTTLTATTHTGATYSWSPTTGLTCSTCASTTATVTATTVYTITADSAGVTATASVTVNVNAAIVPGTGSVTDVKCYGETDGSASIAPTGGSGGFTYKWSNNATTATISNLAGGTYTVTITDVKGCTATASETVTAPSAALSANITPTNASCGSSNGSASVVVSGGTSSYSYHWNSGQTAATISNLTAGNYSVTITDHNGCSVTAATTISTSGGVTPTMSSTNVSCYGTATGSATATVSGSGVSYSWSNGGTTATISNLAAGTYTVTVNNGSGCSATASQTVTQPSAAVSATLSSVNASCNLSNGSVTAAATGGVAGYSYIWSTGATTAGISGLGAGTYQVTVKDANSCSATAQATLSSSAGLNTSASATAVSCYGGSNGSISLTVTGNSGSLTYNWSNGSHNANLSNVPSGNYTVTVSDVSGCSATLSASVTQPAAIDISLTPAGAACGGANGSVTASVTGGNSGYSYSWSNGGSGSSISGLGSGNYSLTVTDNSGCSATASAIVSNTGSLVLTPSVVNATCYGENDGSATINPANGSSPYTYSWSDGDKTATLSNVPAGTYSVTVSDHSGCSNTTSVNITQPSQILFSTSATDCTAGQDNGSATVSNVTGGAGNYTYNWSNGGSTQTINNLVAGTYAVTVSDQNGCQNNASVIVGVATGISDVNNAVAFTLYPNPASADVVVTVNDLSRETTLSLKSILGQQLLFQTLSETQTHVNVSSLAGGVYLIELRQGDKAGVKRLVINR